MSAISPTIRLEVPQTHSSVNFMSSIVTSALTGALAAHLFSIITPIGGAVFGVTSTLSHLLVDEAMNAMGCRNPQNVAFKIAKLVIPSLLAAAVSGLVATVCGFPITFVASLLLIGAIHLTTSLVIAAVASCCIGSCCLLGASVGMPTRSL